MNYGGKRFERGAINASGFFHVVETGAAACPTPSNWGFGE